MTWWLGTPELEGRQNPVAWVPVPPCSCQQRGHLFILPLVSLQAPSSPLGLLQPLTDPYTFPWLVAPNKSQDLTLSVLSAWFKVQTQALTLRQRSEHAYGCLWISLVRFSGWLSPSGWPM